MIYLEQSFDLPMSLSSLSISGSGSGAGGAFFWLFGGSYNYKMLLHLQLYEKTYHNTSEPTIKPTITYLIKSLHFASDLTITGTVDSL